MCLLLLLKSFCWLASRTNCLLVPSWSLEFFASSPHWSLRPSPWVWFHVGLCLSDSRLVIRTDSCRWSLTDLPPQQRRSSAVCKHSSPWTRPSWELTFNYRVSSVELGVWWEWIVLGAGSSSLAPRGVSVPCRWITARSAPGYQQTPVPFHLIKCSMREASPTIFCLSGCFFTLWDWRRSPIR